MTLDELIAEFRDQADDQAVPYLWDEPTLTRYANQADEEAARRSRLLLDATTEAVCKYDVTADDPWITLHASVIEVIHAQIEFTDDEDPPNKTTIYLDRELRYDLDRDRSCWREDKGDPGAFVPDIERGKLRFDRIPSRDGVLRLEVSRLPLTAMSAGTHQPSMPGRYHIDLVQWMLYRAFSRRDSDGFDPNSAAKALAAFERVFGPPSSAIDEQYHQNLPNLRRRSRGKFF
jgi:hypothetical protein